MNNRNYARELVVEIMKSFDDAERYNLKFQKMRVTAAKYKALFFGKNDLSDRLARQEEENIDACTGEFDGFSYSSKRARAVFRTLEDMRDDGILTADEFAYCDKA